MSTTFFFVVMINESHGFFPSYRGLLQGDLLSHYLFVLVIDDLESILKEALRFRYH